MITRFVICLSILAFLATAEASENIKLSIGSWSFEDIHAKNLQFEINLTAQGLALNAQADSVDLVAPIGKVTKLKLHCNELIILSESFSCASGKLSFFQAELGQQKISFKVEGEPEKDKYQIKIKGLKLASANVSATAYLNRQYWRLLTNTPKLKITELIKASSPYLQEQQRLMLENWEAEGTIKLSADIAGRSDIVKTATVQLAATSLNITDEDSRYVTEDVAILIDLDAKSNKQKWQWKTNVSVGKGQAYGEPVFIDFDATPVNFQAKGSWQQNTGSLVISNAKLNQKNVVKVTANFKGSTEKVEQLNITMAKTKVTKLYENWLQPFVLGTAIDSLELAGDLSLQYHQQSKNYRLSLALDDMFVDDTLNRFAVDGINGTLGWTNYNYPMTTDLQWNKATMYAIPIGQTRLKAKSISSSLSLTQAWDIPIFDGKLKINKLDLQRPGEEGSKWTFDGRLTPISMEKVSNALGWPLLHGKLSGVIPNVKYSNKNIKVDGALTVNLFEGTTVINNLQLDQPFGALPLLYADVDLKEMNLSTLSKTFDFGEITGKLEGKIQGLRLANWRPVQLDAYFATPENDKSRHKISQQAINNLSKVGGGVGGVLQRSFLRFFKDFSYKRLGLSCKLYNEVCEMAGVGEAENGYYIVKGGGLPPRINVVGYTRRVDWPDLIDRLKAVSESSGPVVIE